MADAEPAEGAGAKHTPTAREGEHVAPEHGLGAYHCPLCGVLSVQTWEEGYQHSSTGIGFVRVPAHFAACTNCNGIQIWAERWDERRGTYFVMVEPLVSGGPRAHADMPADVKGDYEEARSIVSISPRGACALLRLATQKLVNDHLQTEGGDLNDRIKRLVDAGLPPMVQQALDSLRVIGNEAVHPGELDLKDDAETATGLFMLMNVIVEDRIARPRQVAEMYAKLPAGKQQGIVDRDRST